MATRCLADIRQAAPPTICWEDTRNAQHEAQVIQRKSEKPARAPTTVRAPHRKSSGMKRGLRRILEKRREQQVLINHLKSTGST
jgi:hypothetical protein